MWNIYSHTTWNISMSQARSQVRQLSFSWLNIRQKGWRKKIMERKSKLVFTPPGPWSNPSNPLLASVAGLGCTERWQKVHSVSKVLSGKSHCWMNVFGVNLGDQTDRRDHDDKVLKYRPSTPSALDHNSGKSGTSAVHLTMSDSEDQTRVRKWI